MAAELPSLHSMAVLLRRSRQRMLMRAVLAAVALVLGAPAAAGAVVVSFDDLPPDTVVTNQYANAGGSGQGVVFGPLPGGAGDGLRPRVIAPGAGLANSGTQVASIANCPGCEFYIPNTTGTFQTPRNTVSVRTGLTGQAEPAVVTLTAYNSAGQVVGTPASATVGFGLGQGVKTKLEVTAPTASIVGFKVSGRDAEDTNSPIAIDDLTFETTGGTPPPPPDFALTATPAFTQITEGRSVAIPISISRFSGSTGPIDLAATGLPEGVTAALDPDPAPAEASTLTLTAAPGAPATRTSPPPMTVTGTPTSPSAGSGQRATTVGIQVRPAFELLAVAIARLDPCTATIPIRVARAADFTDPVTLSLTGGGNGVTATLSGSTLTATGQPTGQPVGPATFTVTGSAPGLPDRSVNVTVSGTCPAEYDARITSMQVTQGVQSPFLPLRSASNPSGTFMYADLGVAARLRRNAPTIVRVYANLASGPATGVKDIPMVLHGTSITGLGNQVTFSGSPITPLTGTRTLTVGPDAPTQTEQASETLAYTFFLPYSWLEFGNGLDLRAQLLPTTRPNQGLSVSACDTAACRSNDTMAIKRMNFTTVPTRIIRPVRMFVTGQPALNPPGEVFNYSGLVWPVPFRVEPYYGAIDITDIANGTSTSKSSDASDELGEWICDHKLPDPGWVVGVHPNVGGVGGLTRSGWWCAAPPRYDVRYAQVRVNRPLTSTAHELGHLLGRPHASACNGGAENGETAEDWPPDQMGFTQSVGLDARWGSGVSGGPFAMMSAPGTGNWFDPMSYCADTASVTDLLAGPKSLDAWASVRNWNAVFDDIVSRRRAAAAPRQAPKKVPSLLVTGHVTGAETTISTVAHTDRALPAGASGYHLVAFDASGNQVADVAMHEARDHVEGEAPPAVLQGTVPSESAVRVAIVRDGEVLSERTRSASAPTVSVTVPRVRAGRATIAWMQSDVDGDKLRAAVSYARDGQHFERIYMGPTSPARVPARLLARAPRARVRVEVTDGFRSATATSRPFRAVGAAPEVRITNPLAGAKATSDTQLVLTGEAFADTGRSITGRALVWRADGRVIGRGASIAVPGLDPGAQRVVLTARDRFGRIGRASVRLRIAGVAPFLTLARAPASVPKSARRVTLTVASSQPARLRVRGQVYEVGRKARRVRVPIKRATKQLRLRVSAGRRHSTRYVRIR